MSSVISSHLDLYCSIQVYSATPKPWFITFLVCHDGLHACLIVHTMFFLAMLFKYVIYLKTFKSITSSYVIPAWEGVHHLHVAS